MHLTFIAARALLFSLAFMGLWFWLLLRVRPLSRAWDALIPQWVTWPGVTLIIAGGLGIVTCVALFVVRGRGTPAIFDAPARFVTIGPYRHVRNPMYLSAVITFSGLALYHRSFAVMVCAATWFLAIHLFVLAVEEPGLRQRFGPSYEEYCRRVRRWWPRPVAIAALVALISASVTAQAARRDFSGTWILNVAASDYGLFPAPERRTDVIEHRGSILKVKRTEVPSGGRERSAEWSCSTEGVECTNVIGGNDMKSTVRWEGAVLVIDTKTTYTQQPATIQDRWTLAPDGRVLTISRHASSPEGTADQVFALERR